MFSRRISISILSLLITMPITLTLTDGGNFVFDRMGGVANNLYVISIPISIIFALFVSFKFLNKVLGKLKLIILSLFGLASIIFKAIYIGQIEYSILFTYTSVVMFAVLFYSFQMYFLGSLKIDTGVNFLENKYIFYPILSILLIVILSWHYSFDLLQLRAAIDNAPDGVEVNMSRIPSTGVPIFITKKIVIYDFEQYFAFILPVMVACANRLNLILHFVIAIAAFYCAKISANSTAIVVIFGVLFFQIIQKFLDKKSFAIFSKFSFVLILCIPFLYIVFMWLIYNYIDIDSSGLDKRSSMIVTYFDSLKWHQVIFPFLSDFRTTSEDMHNEVLELFRAFSFFGLIIFYGIVLKPIFIFFRKFKIQALTFLLIIFVGGLTVENLLHPYTSIILAYTIAFYSAINEKLSNTAKINDSN